MLKKIFITSALFINLIHSFDESFGYAGKQIRGQSFDKIKANLFEKMQKETNPKRIQHIKINPNSKDNLYNKRKDSIEASLRIIYPEQMSKYFFTCLWDKHLTKEILYYTITGEDYKNSKFKNQKDEEFYNFARKELREILILQNNSFGCYDIEDNPESLTDTVESFIEYIKKNAS